MKGGTAMSNAKVIGQRVKYYRNVNRLTQQELAELIGTTAPYISNIELAQKGVSVDRLADICKALRITMSDLCRLNERMIWTPRRSGLPTSLLLARR
jgi:transcriptional regulator with XRE-family HTH domain